MKKFVMFAAVVLMIAASAIAGSPERLFIEANATFAAGSPATTNNDDSCDIGNAPAATLLLPFFSVDFRAASTAAQTTLFTLTNTSSQPQIAHVTLWTDWSFPVIDFNIFLTGYDVQGINLYDIISRGVIPPTGIDVSNEGALSDDNETGNPNFNPAVGVAGSLSNCLALPGPIPGSLLTDIQNALTAGTYSTCAGRIGGTNATAQGYVTVDVADECSQLLPTDETFYTNDILFDNTLIGDYIHVNPTSTTGNYASAENMVSVRAIPEGGPAGAVVATNLPFTFYDRYTPAASRERDRRQPLPGVFAARFIQDVPTGPTGFDTRVQIWREGRIRGELGNPTCAVFAAGNSRYVFNGNLPATRVARFDEQENPSVGGVCQISPCPAELAFVFEEASRNSTTTASFPADFTGTPDLGGWLYLNLNGNGCNVVVAATGPACTDRPGGESQAWVTSNMVAEGRYGIDFDAAWLQNGCTQNPGIAFIGPGPNATVIADTVP